MNILSEHSGRILRTSAGLPTTTSLSGTLLVTTAFAPMNAPRPTTTGPATTAFTHISTLSEMTAGYRALSIEHADRDSMEEGDIRP